MNERECQARLHPHTGHVEVSPQLARERNEALDALIEQAMLRTRALKIAIRTLTAIAEEKSLAGVMAKSTLEQIEAVRPVPDLRPMSEEAARRLTDWAGEDSLDWDATHDHAGPDY